MIFLKVNIPTLYNIYNDVLFINSKIREYRELIKIICIIFQSKHFFSITFATYLSLCVRMSHEVTYCFYDTLKQTFPINCNYF